MFCFFIVCDCLKNTDYTHAFLLLLLFFFLANPQQDCKKKSVKSVKGNIFQSTPRALGQVGCGIRPPKQKEFCSNSSLFGQRPKQTQDNLKELYTKFHG